VIFAVKTEIVDPDARTFVLERQKTMYGGKHVAIGDAIYVFASENEGGTGLIARGTVTASTPLPRIPGVERQAPRVSITIEQTARAKRRLGRPELKAFSDWRSEIPETELNFKFYRQATNKIVGLSERAAAFLEWHF
jgi:hypothetical protein